MSYQNILYEKNDGIATIIINRPKALNALNAATMKELSQVAVEIANDKSVKAVIITGSGDKAFVAGADITEMQPMSAIEGREWGKMGQAVFEKIEKLPQPVIGAINGYALGGGCELSLACDIRIASEKAKFGQPEVTLGITPGFAGTQRLARLVGTGLAKELIYTGDIIDAAEAFRIGLVNKVVVSEELMTAVQTLAEKIASRAPLAVQLSKSAINEGIDADLETGVAYEAEVFGLCFATLDQKEGMQAFAEKRKAAFYGK